jgi:hypothetical protein
MATVLGYLSVALLLAVVVLGAACWLVADRFFGRLIRAYPSLQSELPKPSLIIIGERGGPIRRSYMIYLKDRRYQALSDPDLRALGKRARALLTSYAVCFTFFVIAGLLWNYFHNYGP